MYSNPTGLPSVTEIIEPYIDSQWFTDESRDRGNAVHSAAAAHLQGVFVPTLDPTHQPYFESFKRWSGVIDEVVFVEERLVDERLGFCGKPDLIVRIKGDDGYSLPDLKTGQSKMKAWIIQSAAYRQLAKKAKGIDTIRGFPVRLKPDGSGALPVGDYARDYTRDFNIFIGLINSWRFFN